MIVIIIAAVVVLGQFDIIPACHRLLNRDQAHQSPCFTTCLLSSTDFGTFRRLTPTEWRARDVSVSDVVSDTYDVTINTYNCSYDLPLISLENTGVSIVYCCCRLVYQCMCVCVCVCACVRTCVCASASVRESARVCFMIDVYIKCTDTE